MTTLFVEQPLASPGSAHDPVNGRKDKLRNTEAFNYDGVCKAAHGYAGSA